MNRKKNPDYDSEALTKEMVARITEAFGVYDDRKGRGPCRKTLNDVADQFGITPLKARKILITAGVYSTAMSRKIRALRDSGLNVPEIGKELGLSRASVHSYLPYSKKIYNLKPLSITAEREKRYRKRKQAVKELMVAFGKEENFWKALIAFQWYPLFTGPHNGKNSNGRKYTYHMIGGDKKNSEMEIVIDPVGERISKAALQTAYQKAILLHGAAAAPEQLEVSGAEYLFPLFMRIGLARNCSHLGLS